VSAPALRHRPTTIFFSIITGLLALVAVAPVVVAVIVGRVPDAGAIVSLVYVVPLVLLWRTRVVLEPDAVVLVNGWRTHRLPVSEIHDVRIRILGLNMWRTTVHLRDGRVLTAGGLLAFKIAPGLAGRPPSSLVEPVARVRDHVGLPR
jgi:hypothetical protein